jgi:hypothetical protein
MSDCCSNSRGYATMDTTWVKQERYTLAICKKKTKENFGAFSISAAVRSSNCSSCNRKWANPWDRQPRIYGVN